MDAAANFSMIFQITPIVSDLDNCDVPDLFASLGSTSAFRLARVMRLLRVIRVVRVFASCSKQRDGNSVVKKNAQSAVGKRINEMLVRSMILIVISLQLIDLANSFLLIGTAVV